MRFEYFVMIPLFLILCISYYYILQLYMTPFGMMRCGFNSSLVPYTIPDPKKPTRCPLNGVWSEWTTIGYCSTSCGSCSVAPRMRYCTNRCGDCPCRGISMDIGPCGTALCPFPTVVGTCCRPYRKSIQHDSRSFFCGTASIAALNCPT